MPRAIRFLVALSLLASTAAAQTNAERMLNDRYTRSHDYDLVHQRIELADFNWDSTSFTGKVTTTLVALRPGFDSVVMDAGQKLVIRNVEMNGAKLATGRHGDTLVVKLPKAIGFGDSVTFSVAYDGKVENGRGLTFIDAEKGRAHRPRQIWSQGEDDNNHYWFPTYDFPNDKMSWDMVVTVPKGFTAVSNGTLESDETGARGRTMHWHQAKPSTTYLVSLIVAPLVKVSDTWRNTPVDYYVYPEDSTLAPRLFNVTPDMIEVYSQLTGVDYPWAKYAQTTVADFFGGMENVSATTLVDWLPDNMAYQDRPWFQYILIPHELAHQWFGDYMTTENWANMWLNEGFAEFLPGQYWATKLGRHAEEDYYADEYRQFMNIDRRRRMPLASSGSNNIYPKGALVLEMLKHQLGEKPFWASIHYFLERHAYDNAVTDDLRQAVLETTGQNLDWFWDQWMYQAGYPEFKVTASYDTAGKALTLAVSQVQVDSSKADSTGLRYTTPSIFRMPVTVKVGTSNGEVTRRFQLDQREQTLLIDSLPGAPTMVIFDDDNTILKTLDFQQPTAWLVTQLAQDPDLWNRQWVIGELADRTDDAAAREALSRAATSADYYLTRAQAVDALTAFDAAGLPAIERALSDTSAQVREAAAGALGQVGGDQAIRLAHRAFEQDSSYAVKAAALGAISRIDSTGRHDAMGKGLVMKSYRDVIQQAALGGIFRTGDSTFVPQLETLMPEQNAASLVLAGLASKGSSAARGVLAQHLNDGRRWVRQWVVQAVPRMMKPDQAKAFFQENRKKLKFDDTRTAVDAAMERLNKTE